MKHSTPASSSSRYGALQILGIIVFLTTLGSILYSPSSDNTSSSTSASKAASTSSKQPGPYFVSSAAPAPDAHMAPCRWVFDRYVESEYERLWRNNIHQWQNSVCRTLNTRQHQTASRAIVKRTMDLSAKTPGGSARSIEYQSEVDDYMSRFYYRRECLNLQTANWERASGVGCELIEPLWGMLRDPFDIWCGTDALRDQAIAATMDGQSKAHILPSSFAPWTFSLSGAIPNTPEWFIGSPPWQRSVQVVNHPDYGLLQTPPRNIHLDLGSAYFNLWTGVGTIAASGRWHYETYTQRAGIHFDRFVAVEVTPLSPVTAYSQVPHDLIAAYTLMNVPLTTEPGDRLNTLDLITSLVNPGDFFVFKLDIDSAPIELPIAHALRDNKTLASLVTEMFFEHHVDVAPMRSSWGYDLKEDMKDSYQLFNALRNNGIRAHSWP